jgi:hypothetical protein
MRRLSLERRLSAWKSLVHVVRDCGYLWGSVIAVCTYGSSSKDEGIADLDGGGPEAMVGWSDTQVARVVAEDDNKVSDGQGVLNGLELGYDVDY